MFGAFLLLTPMFAPWYLTWILPFAAIRRAGFLSGAVRIDFPLLSCYLQFAESLPLVVAEFTIPILCWLYIRNSCAII